MTNNRINQLIFHVVYLVVCLLGILDCFNLLFSTELNLDALVYYTTLSNILCFIVIFIVTRDNYNHIKNGKIYGKNNKAIRLKYYATIIIFVTFLIYNFLLVDNIFTRGWNYIGNLTKHILSPLLFVLDFFIFDERHNLRVIDIFLSLTLPLFYAAVIVMRGIMLSSDYKGTIYPYFFLNYKEVGEIGLIKWLVILTIGYLILSCIFFLADKLYSKKKN